MNPSSAVGAVPTYEKVLAAREPEMIGLLRTLVDLDTPSDRKDLVDRAMALVEAECFARGAEVDRIAQSEVGDHLRARWRAARDAAPKVLVLAHLDTVWPAGEAAKRPFAEADGRVTGPGVFDMKAGLVQALFAIDAYAWGAAGGGCSVTLLVTSDEEIGSVTSRPLIEEEARDAAAVFVVEAAAGTALKTARKGVGMFRVVVDGRAAHAGLEPDLGRSAITEMAHQILRLEEIADRARGTTVNVGKVVGGSARNVVPARAEATVDLRVVTAEEAERSEARIRALTPATPGTTVTVSGGINRPPMERTGATEALYRCAEAIAGALGEPLGEALVGGGSDGNFTAALGVPTLDGLGAVGGGAHALDEHVVRSAVPRRTALLAALLHAVGASAPARSAQAPTTHGSRREAS